MGYGETWRRLLAWQPWVGADVRRQVAEAPERDELRRRCLERMATRGMPLWREEPEHCDRCHRELLLGERAVLLSRDEDLLLACPLCAPLLEHEGYSPLIPSLVGHDAQPRTALG